MGARSLNMRSEGDLQSDVLKLCATYRSIGYAIIERCNSGERGGVRMHRRGTPDLMGAVKGGRMFCCELKRPGKGVLCPPSRLAYERACWAASQGKQSLPFSQYAELQAYRKVGAYCCVAHSVEEFEQHIRAAERGDESPGPEQWASKGD